MTATSSLEADGFHITGFNQARPFANFLPGIAGEAGKPMWVFYCNRGQCISSFGVQNRNGAMLEFHPANKAYALTPLLGFRSFIRLATASGPLLHEAFQTQPQVGVVQRMVVRAAEVEIEETHHALGLRLRVLTFTLPGESLPAMVRQVTLENIGTAPLQADVLDGLPQVVPFGLEEKLLKQLSRTMEAFAEIRHIDAALPFFKLKVEPSDKAEVQWIDGGFFAFTLQDAKTVPLLVDPDLVFGTDTSLRTPLPFARGDNADPLAARSQTLTGCAFAQLKVNLHPGTATGWVSFFGQAPHWPAAQALRQRVLGRSVLVPNKRLENSALIASLGERLALIAGPPELDPYTRQAFLDNTLRGGLPVVVPGPRGARVFHTFTRKHGDMERDYNAFEVAPAYWSQGSANFRDVNQNRRSENFTHATVDTANIDTFFGLLQLDGNNPLVVQAETFCVPAEHLAALVQAWPAASTPAWQAFLARPFSPCDLLEQLLAAPPGPLQEQPLPDVPTPPPPAAADAATTPQQVRPQFDLVLGHAERLQGASHGEGYWVDHWIYNLDLIDSYAALYPDRLCALLLERNDFGYFDNDHVVQPRDRKYVLRADGTVRQLHAVVQDSHKARLIASRSEHPHALRSAHGLGPIYRSTLLAKLLGLLAIKTSLLDPGGIGLEMEAEKPGWCDALNGLPGLLGSSTHEAFALQRLAQRVRRTVHTWLPADGGVLVAAEVASLLRSITQILGVADAQDFFPTWQKLATRREAFRAETCMGLAGDELRLPAAEILLFLDGAEAALQRGLARAVDPQGLPISYYTHEVVEHEVLPAAPRPPQAQAAPVFVRALRVVQRPVSAAFLEGAVHALRACSTPAQAQPLYKAVRQSALFDDKLGMYRVNTPLDAESFEIGRSRVFTPGWLENESVFLHMHYKFLLETLRSGLAAEFFDDLKRGLVAFQNPEVYGRSPLENSSFIASSRFPDAAVHGVGFVARLSGATAEWISMVLHMGLGAAPFRVVGGTLRFEPQPVLASWLFSHQASHGFAAHSFGFKLFGSTWVVYDNPQRLPTFGPGAAVVRSFELQHADGRQENHAGAWLPAPQALALRDGGLTSLLIRMA